VFGGAYVRDFGMDRDRLELTGGISLPIWVPKIVAAIREAESEKRRSLAEVRSTENRVLDEVTSTRARLAGAAEAYAILADDALPKARQNVKASQAAYTSGAIDFLALLDAQRMSLMKELETERARAEWVVRRAELDRAVGGSDR
jgi:outer membrane protein TolC